MKKTMLATLFGFSCLLSACGDNTNIELPQVTLNDSSYYAKHLDEAKDIVKQCAAIDQRIEEVRSQIDDPEKLEIFKVKLNSKEYRNFEKNCRNAKDGIYEHEYREKEAAAEKLKSERKKQIEDYIRSELDVYNKKEWSAAILELLNAGHVYKFTYHTLRDSDDVSKNLLENIFSEYWEETGEYLSGKKNDFEQVKSFIKSERYNYLMKFIYFEQANRGVKELLKKPYAELLKDDSYCKTDRRKYSPCTVWEMAVEIKAEETVKAYVADYEKLKTDYNQCVAKFEQYLSSVGVGKEDKNVPYDVYNNLIAEETKIFKAYPCVETEAALKKLNLEYSHYYQLN